MPETPHNLEDLHQVSGSDQEPSVPTRPEIKTFHWTSEGKARATELTTQINDLRSQLATAEQQGDMHHATELLDQIEQASNTLHDFTQTEQELSEQRYQEHLKHPGFEDDKTMVGWVLQEDLFPLEILPEDLNISQDIIPTRFLKEDENSILGKEMLKRAKAMEGTLAGQAYAEYLLDHQGDIPKEWQDNLLIFPGTVWLNSESDLCSPYLSCNVGSWAIGFSSFRGPAQNNDRIVRLNPESLKNKTT